MKTAFCLFVLLSALAARGDVNSCSRIIDLGSAKVVPFDDTISPDSTYAIGWSAFLKKKDAKPIDWSRWNSDNIGDFFFSDNSIDIDGDDYGAENVLIDFWRKTFVALPSEDPALPHKNREYIFAVWGPLVNGVRHALVENDSRFYTENMWLITIDPAGMHATDLAPKLTKVVKAIVQAKRPVGARDYMTFLHDFEPVNSTISINSDTVSLPFISDIPKSMIEMSAVKGTVIVRLSDGEIVKASSATALDDPFAANAQLGQADRNLNRVYEKLMKNLSVPDREVLKKEQLAWIHDIRDPMAEQAGEEVGDQDVPSTAQENRNKELLEQTQKRTAELQNRLK